MKIGSLFSGIGGLELGLEMAGIGQTIWQVEKDGQARYILSKQWPEAKRFEDVRKVHLLPYADLICGGFPCQGISTTGKHRGKSGLGLWADFLRIVKRNVPAFVVVENVHKGWRNWVPIVRSDLYRAGYSTVPIRVRAKDLKGHHDRPRCFIVAYPYCERELPEGFQQQVWEWYSNSSGWGPEPRMARVVDGVPGKVDRYRLLGNAVCPYQAQFVGYFLLQIRKALHV